MSQSLPRSSPISRARFMPTAPTTPCWSKRPSKPRAEPRSSCQGPSLAARRKARSAQPSAAAHSRLGRRALDKFLLYRFARRNLSRNALLPRQDREHLRDLETQLPFSLDAMDRTCQGKIAGPSRGHCLQRQTPLAAAKRLSGFEQAPSKPSPSTKPKTSSPSRRSTGDFRTHDHPSHSARPNQPRTQVSKHFCPIARAEAFQPAVRF
jgi:hypothetical protein